jgi:3-oxoacyl-(acyl-carrier-protein) synthase
MELALEEAELTAGTVDAVVAHATGTPKVRHRRDPRPEQPVRRAGPAGDVAQGTIGHTGASAGRWA